MQGDLGRRRRPLARPDQDLPADYSARRVGHHRTLCKPLNPSQFVDELLGQMDGELRALNDALPKLDWLQVAERRADAIRRTALDAQPEPRNLRRVKSEVLRRWGTVPLVDVLKETVPRTGCLDAVTSVTTGGSVRPDVLAERLLLAIYAYGTNTGLRAVASGAHGHSEDEISLRPTALFHCRGGPLDRRADRRRDVRCAPPRPLGRRLDRGGIGLQRPIRALDQHLLTEWFPYRAMTAAVCWSAGASSAINGTCTVRIDLLQRLGVAAMVEGAMRHDTTMNTRSQLHRPARPDRDRLRDHPTARLRSAAANQADQQGTAVPPSSRRPPTPTRA